MAKAKEDPEREHRINMEVIVDACDEYERAIGWYYYLNTTTLLSGFAQENLR